MVPRPVTSWMSVLRRDGITLPGSVTVRRPMIVMANSLICVSASDGDEA
jgi:hypothetical protein